MLRQIDPNREQIQLQYAIANAFKKLAKVGMLNAVLEHNIKHAKSKQAVMKIMPSKDMIKKIKKIQRFKNASGGSIKRISTSFSLRPISTPIGGQVKK